MHAVKYKPESLFVLSQTPLCGQPVHQDGTRRRWGRYGITLVALEGAGGGGATESPWLALEGTNLNAHPPLRIIPDDPWPPSIPPSSLWPLLHSHFPAPSSHPLPVLRPPAPSSPRSRA